MRSQRSGGILKNDVIGEISLVKKESAPVSLKREEETIISRIDGRISKQVSKPSDAPFLKAFVMSLFRNMQKIIIIIIKRGKRSSEKL